MIIKGNFVYLKSLSIKDSYFIYNLRKKIKLANICIVLQIQFTIK